MGLVGVKRNGRIIGPELCRLEQIGALVIREAMDNDSTNYTTPPLTRADVGRNTKRKRQEASEQGPVHLVSAVEFRRDLTGSIGLEPFTLPGCSECSRCSGCSDGVCVLVVSALVCERPITLTMI